MKKYAKETSVGIFVAVGLICIGYLSFNLGNVRIFSDDHYPVYADFTDVTGLKANAPVEMLGVPVGYVESISLDFDQELAHVKMMVKKNIPLTDDAIASIKTSGLIGDRFVKITPGGVGDKLGPEGYLTDTEPAIDIESLISKYVFGDVK